MNQTQLRARRTSYPGLNVFSSPRYANNRLNNQATSLCVFKRKVESNSKQLYDQKIPSVNDLREICIEDGLIHQFKKMGDYPQEANRSQRIKKMKILVCVCMYNESKHAINLTLKGIYDNLKHLNNAGISPQEVAVVLLQDGILKLVQDRNKRTYAKGEDSMVHFYKKLDRDENKNHCALEERIHTILDEIEAANRNRTGNMVAQNRDFPPTLEKNIALLYQNEWHPSFTDFCEETGEMPYTDRNEKGEEQPEYRLKIFSCFKHLNGTKLSSHLWFFEGFCRYLKPQFVALLDVGTKPDPTGLLNLLKGFNDCNVGGVTGLMSIDSDFRSEEGGDKEEEEEGFFKRNFASIQRAQEYQYIISHFLDKNAESALGFLHVLPGAWSAYRYQALIKSEEYEQDLLSKSYFKMILNPDLQEKDYRQASMYLAQDRILSLGIYCQQDEKYYLKYVPDAIAHTDPMKTHEDLMKQRRRWINSSLFAFLYVFRNYEFNVQESKHGPFDKYILLNLSMILAALSFLTSYITPSIYFYIIYVTINQMSPDNIGVSIVAKVVAIIFVLTYLAAIGGGLTGTNWTKHAEKVSFVLSLFTFTMWGLVTYNIIFLYIFYSQKLDTSSFYAMSILVMTCVNLGCIIIVIGMHLFTHPRYVLKLIRDQISYMFYQGAYSMTMVAHAFCNVDDVSWGTKGSVAGGVNKYQTDKVFFVSSWLFYNSILAYIFIYIDIVLPVKGSTASQGLVFLIIAYYASANIVIKSVLAIGYHFKWVLTQWCCSKLNVQENRKRLVEKYWEASNKNYSEAIINKQLKLRESQRQQHPPGLM